MNSVVDINENKLVEPTQDNSVPSVVSAIPTLPFVFAKRNGVMVGEKKSGQVTVLMRPGVSSATLAEVRR